MTKSQAKYIFRGTEKLADALGLTRQAIHKWPKTLTEKQEKRVLGAASLMGVDVNIPEGIE